MDADKIHWKELFVSALISLIVTSLASFLSNFMLNLNLISQIVFSVVFFIAFLAVSISFILSKKSRKYKEEIKKIEVEKGTILDEKSELYNNNKELEKTIFDFENDCLNNCGSEANIYFLMSLTQNYYDPLRIKYLKEAARKNHVFASLILGNLYETGLTYNNREILPKDCDEARNLYMKIKDNDCFGVSEWLLGWFWEKGLTTEIKAKTLDERLIQARHFYECSLKKGFPKAFNSIGKFYEYGWGGLNKDINKNRQKYSEASEKGDIHGSLNCGHSNINEYLITGNGDYLDAAINEYEKAAEKESVEGWFKLAYSLSLKSDVNRAKEYYIKAISVLQDNVFCAAAYYNLYLFIKQNKLYNDKDIIQAIFGNNSSSMGEAGILLECIIRSYTIFSNIEKSGIILTKEYEEYFEEIKEMILRE